MRGVDGPACRAGNSVSRVTLTPGSSPVAGALASVRSGCSASCARLLQQDGAPGGDVRTSPQQVPALALGHPAPDAPLDPVVEALSQALGVRRAAVAEDADPALNARLREVRAP